MAVVVAVVAATTMLVGACGPAAGPDHAAPGPVREPSSIGELPEGPASPYPWLERGVLHVGGVSVPVEGDRVVFRGGTTLVGRADHRHSRWWLVVGARLVPLVDEDTPYAVPVLSADGGTAAWEVEGGSSAVDQVSRDVSWEVVVYDVPTRSVLGRARLGGRVVCCDQAGMLVVAGVSDDGRVSLSGGPAGGLSIWRAGDPLVRVRVRAASFTGADSWPLGVSYVRAGGSGDRVQFARVDAAGVATELGGVSGSALWSADGRHVVDRVVDPVVDPVGSTGIDVTAPLTGETVTLGLPAAPDWGVLAWEDDTHVLAARMSTGGPAYRSMVRCDASTGACERVRSAAATG